ncbi:MULTISPECIES: hypothetical protein [unclassified Yoonia]|uniref:hypothetical protein n=1 Tax=unclassified Yoonia TaxID=2629118 RepID=UPI002AFFDCC6|nr:MULTISPECIES: hypothetical protein [unclassified Yoonia]
MRTTKAQPDKLWNLAVGGKDHVATYGPVPVFLGRFGVVCDAGTASRNAWIETVGRATERNGISRWYWAYGAGFDLCDYGGYDWYPGLYAALKREQPVGWSVTKVR